MRRLHAAHPFRRPRRTRGRVPLAAACALSLVVAATETGAWVYSASGIADAIASDGSGNVLVAAGGGALRIFKLDGTTGAELWSMQPSPSCCYEDIAADGAGDVFAAGGEGGLFAVAKLDGATGVELWRTTLDGDDPVFDSQQQARAIAIDGAGDVFAVASLRNLVSFFDFTVVKLDGATGAELWRQELTGNATTPSFFSNVARDLALDTSNDVLVAGELVNEDRTYDWLVVKLDGATGSETWRSELDGSRPTADPDTARSIVVDSSGDAIAVGSLYHDPDDLAVVKMDGSSGASGRAAGRFLSARDPGDPSKRQIKANVKDDRIVSPAPGSVNDPRTAGATLRLWNPTTAEEAVFALPPGPDWKGLGKPAGEKGYKYKGPAGDPCVSVFVRHSKLLKVVCKGRSGPIPFTLDEPSQGSLAVSIQFGSLAPQCAEFGGFLRKDEPGHFLAKNAPGDGPCP